MDISGKDWIVWIIAIVIGIIVVVILIVVVIVSDVWLAYNLLEDLRANLLIILGIKIIIIIGLDNLGALGDNLHIIAISSTWIWSITGSRGDDVGIKCIVDANIDNILKELTQCILIIIIKSKVSIPNSAKPIAVIDVEN